MTIMRFSHTEEVLEFQGVKYRATCAVRNELNMWREDDEVIVTMPKTGTPEAYYPRKFPTGAWAVTGVEYTSDTRYAPVKIRTNAIRNVITWHAKDGRYVAPKGVQEDGSYLLHYAENSRTTWGCIRLDSAEDALEIAGEVELALEKGPVVLEVVV